MEKAINITLQLILAVSRSELHFNFFQCLSMSVNLMDFEGSQKVLTRSTCNGRQDSSISQLSVNISNRLKYEFVVNYHSIKFSEIIPANKNLGEDGTKAAP